MPNLFSRLTSIRKFRGIHCGRRREAVPRASWECRSSVVGLRRRCRHARKDRLYGVEGECCFGIASVLSHAFVTPGVLSLKKGMLLMHHLFEDESTDFR
jgi:hypothetical protein